MLSLQDWCAGSKNVVDEGVDEFPRRKDTVRLDENDKKIIKIIKEKERERLANKKRVWIIKLV